MSRGTGNCEPLDMTHPALVDFLNNAHPHRRIIYEDALGKTMVSGEEDFDTTEKIQDLVNEYYRSQCLGDHYTARARLMFKRK